ncbi:MAG: uroporphyrinogen decarboxylase family protein [Planctomycetota bacterium]
MTSRERLWNVYNGKKPDRTPVTIFVTDTDIMDGPPNCVFGQRSDDVIDDLIKFHETLEIDIMLRIGVDVYEPVAFDIDTEDWKNLWELQGKFLVHKIITPKGEISETFNVEGEQFHGKYQDDWMKLRNIRTEALIKSPQDLELIKEYRPQIPKYDFSHIQKITQKLGDRGIILPRVVSSVFNYAAGLLKMEDLFVSPILQPDFYKEMIQFCTDDVIAIGKQIADAGGDVMRIVGNIANGGMVSSDFYMEHIFDYEKKYIDAITNENTKALFHNCGCCISLLEVYGKMLEGQALESFSTVSTGGDITSLTEARQKLGDNVVMVGNFDQVQLLRNGTTEQVRNAARDIFEQTKGDTRFIFSTSDSIIPGTPKENIFAMAETALDCANN